MPRSEGKRLLAATFVHNKFPHRAPEDRALLRCFFAGSNAENIWQLSDDAIIAVVRNELQQILGLRAVPLFARVYKWKSAMAQYGVGHLERLDRIERLRQQFPGLALAGNGYRGIGIPDCVRSGQEAAKQVLNAQTLSEKARDIGWRGASALRLIRPIKNRLQPLRQHSNPTPEHPPYSPSTPAAPRHHQPNLVIGNLRRQSILQRLQPIDSKPPTSRLDHSLLIPINPGRIKLQVSLSRQDLPQRSPQWIIAARGFSQCPQNYFPPSAAAWSRVRAP